MIEVEQACEVYSKSNLDDAVREERSVIVIKDPKLGKRTVLWLRFGSCLDGMTLVTAIGSMICASDIHHDILRFGKPLAACSLLIHIGHQMLWKPTPLAMYSVAQGPSVSTLIQGHHYPSTILVKEEESKGTFRNSLACVFALVAAFWSDMTSINFKEALQKLKDFPNKVTDKKE